MPPLPASWKRYEDGFFQYPTKPSASDPAGEVHLLTDVTVKAVPVSSGNIYYFFGDNPVTEKKIVDVTSKSFIFLTESLNSGHLVSDIISHSNYLSSHSDPNRRDLYISGRIISSFPFLIDLYRRMNPSIEIYPLDDYVQYRFSDVVVRRNHWYVGVKDLSNVPFTLDKNLLSTSCDSAKKNFYVQDLDLILAAVNKIYGESSGSFRLYEKLVFVKVRGDKHSKSPGRALDISNDALACFQESGFHVTSFSEMKSLDQYICTLHNARTLIFSYGANTCANRFFVNDNADVIVLGNQAYESEYLDEGMDARNKFIHYRKTHITLARSQRLLFEVPNSISLPDAEDILRLL